jgi:hypothetical protein
VRAIDSSVAIDSGSPGGEALDVIEIWVPAGRVTMTELDTALLDCSESPFWEPELKDRWL